LNIGKVIERVLELRRDRFDDIGVTVVRQSCPAEADTAASEEEVGQALTQMIDSALPLIASGRERRLVVWARGAARGAIVGIEYRGGIHEEAQSSVKVTEAQEKGAPHSLAQCREFLEKRGARLFVSSLEQGNVRLVMELPPES